MARFFTSRGVPGAALQYLVSLLVVLAISGCAQHVIHQREETSRDYTYIDFARNPAPYTRTGQVGGEHSTFVMVLGFEGDRFSVKMQQGGDAGFIVYGEGVSVRRMASGTDVVIDASATLFTVEVSAMSYGDYVLEIVKR